jgi:hypothetical protein
MADYGYSLVMQAEFVFSLTNTIASIEMADRLYSHPAQ